MQQLEESKHAPFYAPETLQELRIELLKQCPLLCLHCSAHAAPRHTIQLPLARILTLLDEFADGGGSRVTFTGGEPLEYAGLIRLVQRCRERDIRVRLFSSGITLQGEERVTGCEPLKQCASGLEAVMYSVYSFKPETHDTITRIPGSWQLTLKAIEYTLQLGIRAEIHFVPTQKNYREFPDLVALAAKLQIARVGILRFVPHGRGKAKADDLALSREAHLWLRKAVLDARHQYPHIDVHVGSAYNALCINTPLACSAGINQMVIEADGSVLPCSAFSGLRVNDSYGNILTHSLQTVWRSSLYLATVRQAQHHMPHSLGCLAQKAMLAGRVDGYVQDPLETLFHQGA